MGTRKNRLGEAVLSVPTIYVLSKNKKNIENSLQKILNFYNYRKIYILHGRVFVMKKKLSYTRCCRCEIDIFQPLPREPTRKFVSCSTLPH